ncbi:MAG: SusC/RagA family TonB-linked outer membrane protein, partial [Pedobacter sp.]
MSRIFYITFACILFVLMSPDTVLAQQRTIKGNVVDEIAKPLPGVIISVKGENIQTSSDDNGNYTITLPAKSNTLIFKMVGMITKEIAVASGETTVRASLQPDLKNLDEVVVVGYGTVKKSDLTGSVSTLKGSELNRTPSASVDQLLQGKIPGVQVISGSGRPGAGATIRVRGTSSLNGSNSPLMVVDGFPWGDAGNLKQINPDDIESIEVLKDASSAAIYGSRGANGVILITTKKGKLGQSNISLSTLNTVSAMSAKPDLWRDAIDEATFANEAALTGGTPANQLPYLGEIRGGVYFPSIAELRGLDPSKPKWPHNTDWVDLVYRKPFSQSYTLTADGGSEKTKYAISGNYYKEEGLVIKNFYDRFATRLNLDQKLTDAINVGTNVILTYTKNNGVQVNADRTRVFPVYDDKGNYFRTSPTDFGHPLA